jgi:uncharacterized membrane protein YqjE
MGYLAIALRQSVSSFEAYKQMGRKCLFCSYMSYGQKRCAMGMIAVLFYSIALFACIWNFIALSKYNPSEGDLNTRYDDWQNHMK